jgi:hypothetical protein
MGFHRSFTSLSLLALTVAGIAVAPQASARSFDGGSSLCAAQTAPSTCHLYHFKLVSDVTVQVYGYDKAGTLVERASLKRHNSANIYMDSSKVVSTTVWISDFYGPQKFTNNANHCFDTYKETGALGYYYDAKEITNQPCNDK